MKKLLFITRYNEKMELLKLEKSEGYFLEDKNRIFIYDLIYEKLEKEGIKNIYPFVNRGL